MDEYPMDEYVVRPIGVVRSELTDPAACPKQGDEGAPDVWIDVEPAFAAGCTDLAAGDRLVVLTWMHLGDRSELQVHPRDDEQAPLRGVFSTRSASRPNPIGLHEVVVRAVEDGRLRVGPLEAVDGTPVIDLKPVL
jgi:tRNA-Thr(GGU) m(6)t(6)A37 methyltransferase TsaA